MLNSDFPQSIDNPQDFTSSTPPKTPAILGKRKRSNNLNTINANNLDASNPVKRPTLNFKELASELMVTEDKLMSKQKENKLIEYITKKRNKYSLILPQAQADLQEILPNYQEARPDLLISQKGPTKFTIDPSLLMKIIRKGNLMIAQQSPNHVLELEVESKGITWKLGVARNQQRKFVIFKFQGTDITRKNPYFLGQGGFGTAQKIIDISQALHKALKVSKNNVEAIESIFSEVNMLNFVNKSGQPSPGLQEATSEILIFPQGLVAYMTKLYNHSSLTQSIRSISKENLSKNELNGIILALFEGLKHLHDEEIVHGDIKPSNCFVDKDEQAKTRKWLVVIGDVGGAAHKSQLLNSNSVGSIGTAWTAGYLTESDKDDLCAPNQFFDEWFEFIKKRDVFALAATAWFLATNELPYATKNNVADTSKDIKSIETAKLKLGEEVTAILIKALSEYSEERPGLEEIIQTLKKEI